MNLPGILDLNMKNILPKDGVLEYFFPFYEESEAKVIFEQLLADIQWKAEKIRLYGKEFPLPRLTAWYGDPGKSYTYSKIKMIPNPWTKELLEIKKKVELHTKTEFNSLLLNLYRDNNDHVSWHADDERELGNEPVIASLSFGEIRKFQLKHKSDTSCPMISLELEPGSLVVMSGLVQKNWSHRIALTKTPRAPRINLTFRNIKN